MDDSEIYPTNSEAEKNYIRFFLNGKQLYISTLEVEINSSVANQLRAFNEKIFNIQTVKCDIKSYLNLVMI